MLSELLSLTAVAFLWGATNPFIKRGSSVDRFVITQTSSVWKRFLLEAYYLLTNFRFLVPFVLNQLGSVLYFVTLQSVDLSLVVPVANSLTFIFTAVTGTFLGEARPSKNTYIAVLLILCGTSLCCYDKYLSNEKLVIN